MAELVDLNKVEDRAKLVESIEVDIDDWCENEFLDGNRKHLGASLIGRKCSREIWYGFRWVKDQPVKPGGQRTLGQVARLFQRGHREEPIIMQYLKGIGFTFEATPEDQLRISDIGGHFGGSLDNVGRFPPKYQINERVLFEFKTSNMAGFNKLKKNGVVREHPQHWSQMCVYGYKMELRYALYLSVDKNTDAIYMEFLPLDWEHGKAMIDKAGAIITAKEPPPKYSQSQHAFECKNCSFLNICHNGEAVAKNCRSCVYAVPADDKQWVCSFYNNSVIPDDVIAVGCDDHAGVT